METSYGWSFRLHFHIKYEINGIQCEEHITTRPFCVYSNKRMTSSQRFGHKKKRKKLEETEPEVQIIPTHSEVLSELPINL